MDIAIVRTWNRIRTYEKFGLGFVLEIFWDFGHGLGQSHYSEHEHEFGRGYYSRTLDMGKLSSRISGNLWFESILQLLFSEHHFGTVDFELKFFSKSEWSEKDFALNIWFPNDFYIFNQQSSRECFQTT